MIEPAPRSTRAVAVEHGLPLASFDRRAVETYRVLGVDLVLVEAG